MASKAEKFIYTLKAVYEGGDDISKMSSDLEKLGKIESHKKLEKGWQKTSEQFAAAKADMRELKQELAASSDIKIGGQLEKAGAALEKLEMRASRQGVALEALSAKIVKARQKYEQLGAAYEKDKSDKLAVKFRAAGAALEALVQKEDLQRKRLANTSREMEIAAARAEQLGRAYEKSVDPRVARQYELARKNVASLGDALGKQKARLEESRAALEKQKVSLGSLDNEYKKLSASTEKQGRKMAAMRTLGVRSFQDVEKEIKSVRRAYADLEKAGFASLREGIVIKDRMKKKIVELKAETNGWAQQVQRLQQGWLGLAGIIGGGIGFARLVSSSIQSQKALVNFARTAGTSIGEFQAYAYAVKSVGIEQDKLADISKDVKDKIGDFIETGGGEFADFFENVASKVGLTAEELIKMSGPDALVAIKKAMDDANISAENQVFYMEALANDASLLLPLLEKEGEALRKKAEEAKKLGLTMSEIDSQKLLEAGQEFEKVKLVLGALGKGIVVALVPLLKIASEGLVWLLSLFRAIPEPIKQVILAIGGMVTAFAAWKLGLASIASVFTLVFSDVVGLGEKVASVVPGIVNHYIKYRAILLSSRLAMVGLTAAVTAFTAVKVYQLVNEWRAYRDAVREADAAEQRLQKTQERLAPKLEKIKESTGGLVTSWDSFREARQKGLIHWDEEVQLWKKGAGEIIHSVGEVKDATKKSFEGQKRISKETLAEMKQQYKAYVDEIKRLQDEILGRELSLQEQLGEMARSGMDDVSAWEDRKREAEEYEQAARQAAEAGDFETAVEYADKAKAAYADLNQEVKSGDQVLISHQAALETSMSGVKRAGELAIEILKKQQDVAGEAMKGLEDKAGLEKLTEGMNEAEKKWAENWESMREQATADIDAVAPEFVRKED